MVSSRPRRRFRARGRHDRAPSRPSNFRTINRDTAFLLPPSVDEWLPDRHLARLVVAVIDGLDLSELVNAYRGSGSASYHPAMLLGLLVYGYSTKVFCSRAIGRATHDSHDRGVSQALPRADRGPVHRRTEPRPHDAAAQVQQLLRLAEQAGTANIPDGMSIPEELERRAVRLAANAEAKAKAKIEARAGERLEREQAEHQVKRAVRDEQERRTGGYALQRDDAAARRRPRIARSGPRSPPVCRARGAGSAAVPAPRDRRS